MSLCLSTESVAILENPAPVDDVPAYKSPLKRRIEKLEAINEKTRATHIENERNLNYLQKEYTNTFSKIYETEKLLVRAQRLLKEEKKKQKQKFRTLSLAQNGYTQSKCKAQKSQQRLKSAIKEELMQERISEWTLEKRRNLSELAKKNTLDLEWIATNVPNDVLKIIASYIPYDVRIQMINHFHHPLYYLRQISSIDLGNLLYEIISYRKVGYGCKSTLLINGSHNEYDAYRKEESLVKIKFMMTLFEERAPEFALRFLKILAVLQKANNNIEKWVVLVLKQSPHFAYEDGLYLPH
jgi:hypothetical protein